jgi:fructoselysine-6-P-deglycase FrlB-like protein
LISLTLHQLVVAQLGVDAAPALAVLEKPQEPDISAAADRLKDCTAVVFSGRGQRGLAEAAALGAMELGRMPAYALEGGQMRHGPMEILGPKVGVVIFRAAEAAAGLGNDLAAQAVAAGSPTVLFDASGSDSKAAAAGALRLSFNPADGLAASLAMLPAAQRLVIALAAQRVPDVGTPVRSGKVTRVE